MELYTNCDSLVHYKVRWTVIINCDSFFYDKGRHGLLQVTTGITKCDGFIRNCNGYYEVRWLLQIATVQPLQKRGFTFPADLSKNPISHSDISHLDNFLNYRDLFNNCNNKQVQVRNCYS